MLIEPRSAGEDDRQKEFILNVILFGATFLLFCSDALILIASDGFLGGQNFFKFLHFSWLLGIFAAIYALSRIGCRLLASYLLIGFFFAGAVYGTMRWGASLGPVLLFYALIIAISSIIIGSRFGMLMTCLTIAILLKIGIAESHTAAIPIWKSKNIGIGDLIQLSVELALIQTVSWLSNREIKKNLSRARFSEQALKEERDTLEIKVADRTAELRRAQGEKLSQLYRFVEFGKLSSGLFHDLMGTLSLVTLQVGRLKDEFHPAMPEMKESIDKTISASHRMERFMSTIRKQIRTEDFEECFSVNSEAEEAITLFSYKAMKSGVSLRFEADQEISSFGNPIKFHHMISNLISNAIDSYDGDSVPPEKREIVILLSATAEEIKISVRDGGSGVPQELREKIFDPMFTTKLGGRGTGLGLSTTADAIRKNFGGILALEDAKGGGSIFTLTFPYREASDKSSRSGSSEGSRIPGSVPR